MERDQPSQREEDFLLGAETTKATETTDDDEEEAKVRSTRRKRRCPTKMELAKGATSVTILIIFLALIWYFAEDFVR